MFTHNGFNPDVIRSVSKDILSAPMMESPVYSIYKLDPYEYPMTVLSGRRPGKTRCSLVIELGRAGLTPEQIKQLLAEFELL